MAAKRKTKKKITLSEFKTWLAGVQSMQPEGWHPSKENWAMVLEQIDNITETVVTKEVFVPTTNADNPANAQLAQVGNPAAAYQHRPMPAQPVRQQNHAPSQIPFDNNPANNRPVGTPQGENGLMTVEPPSGDGEYESSFS